MMEHKDDFRVPQHEKKEHPTAEQVAANQRKWGLAT
jgi:hypothetical protein